MISFLLCLALLIVGYFVYGKIVDNTFGPDDRETPAVRINDGVDYVVMPQWKLFLVQLLNIAGLGPIFGALQGALWGPVVFLWITFGTIFAGGVHDYFSGMMSERNDGASIAEVTGRYLGPVMQNIMRVFSVVLLIMVGTVFAVGPAGLIVTLCKNGGMSGVLTTTLFWLIIILVYYFIATFISIDAIIGKIYPVFGICLIIMAVGVIFGIFTNPAYTIPEIWANFSNMHPSNTPIWSFMFITVACGAISGFHSTQSPLMARCMKSEKQGHFVFYGAMVSEGIIALIWAAAGCALYTITDGKMVGLAEALAAGQSAAIYDVCLKTMGNVGVALAMIGVVICPITSGDTAFRSARLTLADWLKIDQFYRAEVSLATNKRCIYEVKEVMPQQPAWRGHIHLAIAPTKMMDRIEWMAEKATEIGFDEISFLNCKFSERKVIRIDRIDKIVVSAVKQSHKAWKPVVNELQNFKDFITAPRNGRKFICHCYEEIEKKDFFAEISKSCPADDSAGAAQEGADDITVLVGPEGDFSIDEVRLALENGYESVSLGTSRLRTETAGLVAVNMCHLARAL